MKINVWIVSYFNAFDGSLYNNLHTSCDEAISNFEEVVNEAIKFASGELSDFRVSRNVNTITIYDVENDRVVVSCEVIKHTIICG
jgi:hypothetical protein